MKFIETEFEGVYLIKLEPYEDNRGIFVRTFCAQEFKEHGLSNNMVQINLSINNFKNIIRGMHYQGEKTKEDKLVSCIKGRILDVIIDIRKNSKTFGKHIKVELSKENNTMLYIPRGIAHGFLTLETESYVVYKVSDYYSPEKERGIRWNDPYFNIQWPIDDPILSNRDANHEDFSEDRVVNL